MRVWKGDAQSCTGKKIYYVGQLFPEQPLLLRKLLNLFGSQFLASKTTFLTFLLPQVEAANDTRRNTVAKHYQQNC